MKTYFFTISASYAKCEQLYMTGNNAVVLHADSGEKVQIPSQNLRRFIDRQGLNGRFRMLVNSQNKIHSFDKIR